MGRASAPNDSAGRMNLAIERGGASYWPAYGLYWGNCQLQIVFSQKPFRTEARVSVHAQLEMEASWLVATCGRYSRAGVTQYAETAARIRTPRASARTLRAAAAPPSSQPTSTGARIIAPR